MKIAYFDCSSGIAGNMIVGALLDAGMPKEYLIKELLKIRNPKSEIRNKFQVKISNVKRGSLLGTYFNVKLRGSDHPRSLKNILNIIKKSKLSKDVKQLSSRIFKRLAKAEAKVHGVPINKIYFHEVGATDAIIDIVGTAIGLEKLKIRQIYSSPINVGSGKVSFSHGTFSVPAPATAQLLKGVPFYSTNTKTEIATPTGVAIITTLAESFGDIPRICLENMGFGVGSKNIKGLSPLGVYIGKKEVQARPDIVLMLEANLDDMNPKHFDKVIKKLMKAGALDAYFQPLHMKKGRNAYKLTALSPPSKKNKILKAFFNETPTLGVRVYLTKREVLDRDFITLKTKWGKLRIKVGKLEGKIKTLSPEFKDLKKIASKHKTPLASVLKELSFNY